MSKEKVKSKGGKAKSKDKTTKAKAKKDDGPPRVVTLKHSKAKPEYDLNVLTGTRYAPNTSKQMAFDIILKNANNGKKVKEIRAELARCRKENGFARNLDAGYFNFAVAMHPEFFEVYSDGTVRVKKEPKPDKEALKKAEKKEDERKKRAASARKSLKKGGKKNAKSKRSKEAAPEEAVA